jgi:GDP-mannose 6-dehydrogenase
MKILVCGLGQVGSVTAQELSKAGHDVHAVDPGMSQAESAKVHAQVQTHYGHTPPGIDVALVCVDTPRGDWGLSIESVRQCVYELNGALTQEAVVAIRSTILPTHVPTLREALHPRHTFAVNPEFMREGMKQHDFQNPSLRVLGADTTQAVNMLRCVYSHYDHTPTVMSPKEAALTKVACNAFHATKVAFANEIDQVAQDHSCDGKKVMGALASDGRLNASDAYLTPGFAYGGHCLPKDTAALADLADASGVAAPLVQSLNLSNQHHLEAYADALCKGDVSGVGVLGVAFKQGVQDTRGSKSIELIELLLEQNVTVHVASNQVPRTDIPVSGKGVTVYDDPLTMLDAVDRAILTVATDKHLQAVEETSTPVIKAQSG